MCIGTEVDSSIKFTEFNSSFIILISWYNSRNDPASFIWYTIGNQHRSGGAPSGGGILTDGQAAELVWEGVKSGKISAWDGAKHLGGGLKKAGDALWNTATEPAKQAWNYAKENPWQAAAIVAGAVAVTAAIVLFPPAAAFAGAALTYGAQAAAVWTAGNLAYAYATGGTDGLAQKMFSSETRQLWASGDVWGAIGKGTADIGVQTMAMLPLAGVPKTIASLSKAGAAIVNGVNNLKNFRNLAGSLSNIRVTVALTDSSGILNNGGMQIVKNAIQKGTQYGSGVVDEIGTFIKGLSKDKLAVAALNKQGEVVEQAAGVSNGAEVSWSVEQILGVSESLECTWRPPQEPMKGFEEGKLWTSGGKGRSTATFVLNAGPAEANAIYDGESVTGWFEVMGVKQGFKMNKAELDAANESMTPQEREQAEQYRSEMIVSCRPWNPDPSYFVVPSDVSFDMPAMPGT